VRIVRPSRRLGLVVVSVSLALGTGGSALAAELPRLTPLPAPLPQLVGGSQPARPSSSSSAQGVYRGQHVVVLAADGVRR
jgi:hypothetical protein